jgi:5-formaminoimidazole-4-carboxamide-1-beta-D-ribofuranosyl 5'-monophosphate synthetase
MLNPSGLILQLSEVIVLRVVFIFVKNNIASAELCINDDFEMIAIELKGMDAKYKQQIISIYRTPNDDMLAIERSVAYTLPT